MRAVRKLFRAVLILAACALLIEGSFRLALPEFNPANHLSFSWNQGDLKLGHPGSVQRQIKNTGDFNVEVRFNELGLRDSDDVRDAEASDFIMSGDSFIFGWGVQEADRISEKLADRIGRRVFNAAVPGDLDTYARLVEYASGGTPRRVILGLSMESDIIDYGAVELPAPTASPQNEKSVFNLTAIKGLLIENVATYFLLTQQVHRTPWLRDAAVRLELISPNLQRTAGRIPSPSAIEATIERTAEISHRLDATLVVLPSRYVWFGDAKSELSDIHETIVSGLRKRNVDLVDLKPAFEADGNPLEYHFANDPHWRPRGHAKAAEVLAQHIKLRYGDAL